MLWIHFSHFLLPIIFFGAIYFWRVHKRIFSLLSLVIVTNFVLSSLYLSGNQESWYMQSYIVFAIFIGGGYYWLAEIMKSKLYMLDYKFKLIAIFLFSLIPLLYWWSTLDRRDWQITKEYIDNLYAPVQGSAILIGTGDLFDATSYYVHDVIGKHDVIPVID